MEKTDVCTTKVTAPLHSDSCRAIIQQSVWFCNATILVDFVFLFESLQV